MILNRPIQTRFRYAFLRNEVKLAAYSNSSVHYAKGTQSQNKVCSHCLYAYGFRIYFTPLSGVLFAFPSRYWFTIGHQGVFSFGRWSSRLPTRFHGPRGTQVPHPTSQILFVYRALTFFGWLFQAILLRIWFLTRRRHRNVVK